MHNFQFERVFTEISIFIELKSITAMNIWSGCSSSTKIPSVFMHFLCIVCFWQRLHLVSRILSRQPTAILDKPAATVGTAKYWSWCCWPIRSNPTQRRSAANSTKWLLEQCSKRGMNWCDFFCLFFGGWLFGHYCLFAYPTLLMFHICNVYYFCYLYHTPLQQIR